MTSSATSPEQAPEQAPEQVAETAAPLLVLLQYGKVGSTSLKNAFTGHPDVEICHSHSLGLDRLGDYLQACCSADQNDFFHLHQTAHLARNISLTRRIDIERRKVLAGAADARRIVFLSPVRAPMDYFRSATTQTVLGLAPHLAALAALDGGPGRADTGDAAAEPIGRGLTFAMELLAEGLAARRWIDADWARAVRTDPQATLGLPARARADFVPLFDIFLRPHLWMQANVGHFLGTDILAYPEIAPGLFRADTPWCASYIFRYEETAAQLPAFFADAGLPAVSPSRDNVSRGKPHEEAVRRAFSGEAAARLGAVARSACSTRFGYHDGAVSPSAS